MKSNSWNWFIFVRPTNQPTSSHANIKIFGGQTGQAGSYSHLLFDISKIPSPPVSSPQSAQQNPVPWCPSNLYNFIFLLLLKFCRDEKSYDRKNPALRVNGLAGVLWLCNNYNRKISLSGLRGFLLV